MSNDDRSMPRLHRALLALYLLLLPFRVRLDLPLHLSLSDVVLVLCMLVLARRFVHQVRWNFWHVAIVHSILLALLLAVVRDGRVSSYALMNRAVGIYVLFCIYGVVYAAVSTWSDVKFMLKVMCIGVAGQNLVAILEFVLSWLLRTDMLPWINSYERLAGLYGDPNAYGGLLVVALMILLGTSSTPRPLFGRAFSYLQIVTLCVGLILTFSRSAWIALFAGLSVLAWYRPIFMAKFAMMLVCVLLVVFGGHHEFSSRMLALATRTEQVHQRLDILGRAVKLWMEHPFVGAGLGKYYEEFGVIVHNTMMWWLVECGVIGLVAFIGLVSSNVARCQRVIRCVGPEHRFLVVGLLAAHVAMLGLSVGIEAFYQRQWWVILGLIAAVWAVVCGAGVYQGGTVGKMVSSGANGESAD